MTAAQRLAARKARRQRSDDELLHMSADGRVSTVANAGQPILVHDEDFPDELQPAADSEDRPE
jgi:GTP-binding protein